MGSVHACDWTLPGRMRTTNIFLIFIFVSQTISASKDMSTKVGKLFWESTASTTSTLSTTTQCFVTSGAVSACTRKKRSIEYDVDGTGSPISATPSRSVARGDGEDLEGEKGVQPGMEEAPNRQARFVLYWRTTTATSTSTSYTATSTLASITCTPNGFPLSVCG